MTKLELEFALAQQVDCITEVRSSCGLIDCDARLLELVAETIRKELASRLREFKVL